MLVNHYPNRECCLVTGPWSGLTGSPRYNHAWNLRRSRTRLDILIFLANIHPESVPLSEIARGTGHSPTDIAGALRGMGKRFRTENSLIQEGLVERVSTRGRNFYLASYEGLDALKRMVHTDPTRFEGKIVQRILVDRSEISIKPRVSWRPNG